MERVAGSLAHKNPTRASLIPSPSRRGRCLRAGDVSRALLREPAVSTPPRATLARPKFVSGGASVAAGLAHAAARRKTARVAHVGPAAGPEARGGGHSVDVRAAVRAATVARDVTNIDGTSRAASTRRDALARLPSRRRTSWRPRDTRRKGPNTSDGTNSRAPATGRRSTPRYSRPMQRRAAKTYLAGPIAGIDGSSPEASCWS